MNHRTALKSLLAVAVLALAGPVLAQTKLKWEIGRAHV